jgi:hypothetical protein
MVPAMFRKIATIAVLGVLGAGIGCNHIGGKADCGYNPADYPIHPPTQPYPSFPPVAVAEQPPITPTEKMPDPMDKKDAGKPKN